MVIDFLNISTKAPWIWYQYKIQCGHIRNFSVIFIMKIREKSRQLYSLSTSTHCHFQNVWSKSSFFQLSLSPLSQTFICIFSNENPTDCQQDTLYICIMWLTICTHFFGRYSKYRFKKIANKNQTKKNHGDKQWQKKN